MRLENVLALTHGHLVNEPFVKLFTNVVFEAKAVKRGDLFMAFDDATIEEAILNGAYGIVFSKPTQISDSEIAWIKVTSVENALARLLRFRLIEKDITVYSCNEIVLKLALQIITTPAFIVLYGDTKKITKLLWDVEDETTVLFSPALTSADLFTKILQLPHNSNNNINIIEQTLFETSFIYEDMFYERQLISPFFIPYLETLLELFKNKKIEYRLRKFLPIEHFEAVFTNKKFEVKEFGTSDKVLIFEKNSALVESEVLFLQREARWAKIIYVLPHNQEKIIAQIENKDALIVYKHENEIVTLLKESSFHFALIIGVDKTILTKPINNQTDLSLFDFQ